jgi:phosphate transport system substrate-binding protein
LKKTILGVAMAGLALASCARGGSQPVHIVGSSTVYPFTTAVAEHFQRATRDISVIVESTGTGSGLKLFCAGVGDRYPDMTNASRRIKASELADCHANGVSQVIEVPIGIDGLALIESASRGAGLQLTQKDVYEALAANPYGRPNRARTWRDVNPTLPDVRILVYGPPPTSGTRDSFVELILEKGCEVDPAMRALKESDKDRHRDLCTRIREDGAFVEAGENDNLLVQKVYQEPGAVGVLGYSFLEENLDRVRGIPMNGVVPTAETIRELDYPGARQIFLYAKGEHLDVVPGMREFLVEYARSWGLAGYLVRRGLIPSPDAVQENARRSILEARPLTPQELV